MSKNLTQSIAQPQPQEVETSNQFFNLKNSIESYIVNPPSNTSAIFHKYASKTSSSNYRILFITTICISCLIPMTNSISTSLPSLAFYSDQIFTGNAILSTTQITPTVVSGYSSLKYDVNIPTGYNTYIGMNGLSVSNITIGNTYVCLLQFFDVSDTIFRIRTKSSTNINIYWIGVNYIAIEQMYFNEMVEYKYSDSWLNVSLISPYSIQLQYNLLNIENGSTYKPVRIMQFIRLRAIVDSNGVAYISDLVDINYANQQLTRSIQGNNIFIESGMIHALIFKLDPTKNTKLQFHFVSTTNAGDKLMFIDTDLPNLEINENNTIIGLCGFSFTNTQMDFKFYHNNGEVWLHNSAVSPSVSAYITVIYSIQCSSLFYQSDIDGTCKRCFDDCIKCSNISICQECAVNYTLENSNTECNCQFLTISGICYDFENSPMKSCQNAEIDPSSNEIICLQCSKIENLILDNNECICKEGYQRADSSTSCSEICGDSLIFEAECDDGNTANNDGCSSQCLSEEGFECDNSNGSTICKSQEPLSLSVTKMLKNRDNSAIFTVSSDSAQGLPFDFEKQQFEGSSMLKLTVYSAATNDSTVLNTEILSIQGLSIEFLVIFDFTIENLQSELWLNTSLTKYTTTEKSIQFTSKGDNKVLKVSQFFETYEAISVPVLVVGVLALVLLFVGLLAPKFIGLQTLLTLSLIYLSQILIVDPQNIPVGFLYLEPLRYALGYSDLIHLTSYSANSEVSQKFAYLEFKKTTVENFNASFVLLVTSFIVFVFSVLIRLRKEWNLQKRKEEQKGEAKAQMLIQGIENQAGSFKEEREAVSYWTKVNEKCLHVVTQISFWCILQVFSAASAQLNIINSAVTTLQESVLSHFNGSVIAVSLFIIVTVGLTYSFNVYLSFKTLVQMAERPSELLYKKMLFVYLFVMAYLIMFCFWVELPHFFCSTAVLAVHLIYMGALIKVHPYQLSLHIHSVGLFSNQVILLVVLLFINALNYFGEFNEVLVLALGFFVVGTCGAVVAIGAVRLYYEYRYGKELQEEIQEERKMRSRKERQRAKKEFNDMQQLYRLEARNRQTPLERIRARNQFLVENQFLEDKKEFFWDYLQSKIHLAKEIKEKHYFDIFDQKPLSWLKIHKPKEYKEEMEALQQWRREYHEKEIKKRNDPEFKALHKRLNNEFRRKKKQAKLNRMHNKFP